MSLLHNRLEIFKHTELDRGTSSWGSADIFLLLHLYDVFLFWMGRSSQLPYQEPRLRLARRRKMSQSQNCVPLFHSPPVGQSLSHSPPLASRQAGMYLHWASKCGGKDPCYQRLCQEGADWGSVYSKYCRFYSSQLALNLSNDCLQQIEFENVSTISSNVCLRNKCQLLPGKSKKRQCFRGVDRGSCRPYLCYCGRSFHLSWWTETPVILG